MVKETPSATRITMDDVQRIVGALTLEVEILRRENAALRAALQQIEFQSGPPPVLKSSEP